MGLPKGQTNNLNGRPPGSANKVGNEIKSKLARWLENGFEQFEEDINQLDPEKRATMYLKALEFIVPKRREQLEDNKEVKKNLPAWLVPEPSNN